MKEGQTICYQYYWYNSGSCSFHALDLSGVWHFGKKVASWRIKKLKQ